MEKFSEAEYRERIEIEAEPPTHPNFETDSSCDWIVSPETIARVTPETVSCLWWSVRRMFPDLLDHDIQKIVALALDISACSSRVHNRKLLGYHVFPWEEE